MDDVGRVRWERMLLVLAALVGIVAMHSMIGPAHDDTMPPSSASSALSVAASPVDHHGANAASPGGEGVATAAVGSGVGPMAPMSPMSMPHALMHLCLAVMTAGIVLGLLALALWAVAAYDWSPLPRASHPDVRPARPPLPIGTRLAQLCVLRN